jgi:hypothetical protein
MYRKHSTNIQETFEEPSGNIQETFKTIDVAGGLGGTAATLPGEHKCTGNVRG